MESETWRPIAGHPNYEVSDYGRVRSLGPRARVLSPYAKRHPSGRVEAAVVNLCTNGRQQTTRVHRLVLETFVGPAPAGQEGCHNDGNPVNNRLENLRWDAHVENMRDRVEHGTATPPPVRRGEAHYNTSLTADHIRAIRAPAYRHGLHSQLGREYGVSNQTIRRIRQREVWAHVT